jgi:hypothetical protein
MCFWEGHGLKPCRYSHEKTWALALKEKVQLRAKAFMKHALENQPKLLTSHLRIVN